MWHDRHIVLSLVITWLTVPPRRVRSNKRTQPSEHAWDLPRDCDGELPMTTLSGLNFDISGLDLTQKTNNSYTQIKEPFRTTTFLTKDKCIRSSKIHTEMAGDILFQGLHKTSS